MEEWEDEHIPPLNLKEQPKSKWDDEDVDENVVKESWEDEDEPASAPPPPSVKPTEKAPQISSEKVINKKGKKVAIEKEEPLDPLAEKLRQQRLVEEADYKTTKELFGSRSDEKNLDNFIPKSESEFLEYAELISHKLRPFEKNDHYMNLLKRVMRLSMTSLKGSEAKEIASSITAIANEKIKAEKEANTGKKKTGAKKKQLLLDKPDEDLVSDPYSALDDYDFM
ncbi:eukaryotic translation initiation factor 3 subunit J isoform X2 [Neltuma alba]|uniref:eukaryotic translation initiation factor 3 subunit J isoform X2 n=1 Tax=Neltuma alba TaxID=207710 RepID=UPI0010A54367|nr:eukaryotic translation initiation factor 3 subunit J-like isoform X2 [Prosopis alba]XP_028805562.1 eukaryotic translation initiation factor 3 subunit J-like isoform X2 [Prosopis alba]XP_028805563.1 eukaryotic translation initiation factor 3 subunit J-like isoform X2 [Prosopis alba]